MGVEEKEEIMMSVFILRSPSVFIIIIILYLLLLFSAGEVLLYLVDWY